MYRWSGEGDDSFLLVLYFSFACSGSVCTTTIVRGVFPDGTLFDSGVVFSMPIEGVLPDGTLFDSGLVYSKTFEGVSFRTGLRG